MATVLVVDDDRATRHVISQAFENRGLTVLTARSASDGLEIVAEQHPDVVLLDVLLPDISGLEAYQNIRRLDPRLPVIFITAGGSSDTAIEAVKIGAFDYLLKPLDLAQVRNLVDQALEMRRLMHVPVALPGAQPGAEEGHGQEDRMIGRSPQVLEVYKSIGRVASQDVTVLIRGESGTGKELIARAIYQHSQRSKAPFLAVNCAAIPDALLESELFGHEKGSFTGADRQRIGKFEQCSGGTIFLDEVGDMSPLVQGKLLRLLQEQRFERVGGNQTIQTDVRIIAATHRDLEDMSSRGQFRSDLYYRLNGFTIAIPPLRERGDDIVLLLERFFSLYSRQLNKDVQGIAPDAVKLLVDYPWPGNVREMQSAVRRALLQTNGPVLTADALPDEIRVAGKPADSRSSNGSDRGGGVLERVVDERLDAQTSDLYGETLAAMEAYLLTRVLRLTDGNQSQASRILGITRGSLRNKIHAHAIQIGNSIEVEEGTPEELEETVAPAV
ncbi:MAG TPA: sigma-54 dependent transcriptional regulator [Planctomycetaceae bacterium]